MYEGGVVEHIPFLQYMQPSIAVEHCGLLEHDAPQ